MKNAELKPRCSQTKTVNGIVLQCQKRPEHNGRCFFYYQGVKIESGI